MTTLLTDTSVLIKWFQTEREEEIEAARALLAAHHGQDITVAMLDLALFEFGNALLRRFRLAAAEVAAQLADLLTIVGTRSRMPRIGSTALQRWPMSMT